MSTLILTRGIPGSGKSYWAKQWVLEDPENRIRVNRDDIRNMLGKYWVPSRENMVTKIEDDIIKDAMNKNKDIVIDDMNLNPKTINKFKELVNKFNECHENMYEIGMQDFFTPLDICIERDSKREHSIGEMTIKNIWKLYRQDIWSREAQAKLDSLRTYDAKLKDCILVDMDATLAFNTSGRPFYGDACAEGIKYDEPLLATISIVRAMRMTGTCKIIILTGRDETCRIETMEWLENNNVPYDWLLMREAGDYSSGTICKEKIYNEQIKPKFNVLFALDDDPKIADMYRKNGIICLQP